MVENANLIEGVKLLYDYLKHLATLATGSIVLLATFLSRNPPATHWRALAASAIICFVVSIIGTLISAGVYALRAEMGDFSYIQGVAAYMATLPFLISAISFIIALILLSLFTIRNLW